MDENITFWLFNYIAENSGILLIPWEFKRCEINFETIDDLR